MIDNTFSKYQLQQCEKSSLIEEYNQFSFYIFIQITLCLTWLIRLNQIQCRSNLYFKINESSTFRTKVLHFKLNVAIDGMLRAFCHPTNDQEKYDSGHKREYCVKYQPLLYPHGGVTTCLLGTFPGKRQWFWYLSRIYFISIRTHYLQRVDAM